jgi:hypothetical protein
MMERFKDFIQQHPRLSNWIFLSIGMVILFVWAARGQELTAGQFVGLAGACVALAGACAWIISWE